MHTLNGSLIVNVQTAWNKFTMIVYLEGKIITYEVLSTFCRVDHIRCMILGIVQKFF